MHEAHWRLSRPAFECDADGAFYYPSRAHEGALLKLRYVVEHHKGVGLLVGPHGSGKTYLTLRLAYMACEYFNADLGLAIVRAEHQAFYRRVFLHETIAEPRMFPGLLKPVGLMAADFPAMKEKVFERYPIMRSTAFERRMLFERANARRARPAAAVPEYGRAVMGPNS